MSESKQERIARAREHYETRAERRPKQTWPVGPRDGKRKPKEAAA